MKIILIYNINLAIKRGEEEHDEKSIVSSAFKNENLGIYMKVFPCDFHLSWALILLRLSQKVF